MLINKDKGDLQIVKKILVVLPASNGICKNIIDELFKKTSIHNIETATASSAKPYMKIDIIQKIRQHAYDKIWVVSLSSKVNIKEMTSEFFLNTEI